MSQPKLDVPAFTRHFQRLVHALQDENQSELNELDGMVVIHGKPEETYSKSISTHIWLFGIELQDCVLVLTKKEFIVWASKKKLEYLKPINNLSIDGIKITFILKESGNVDEKCIDQICQSITSSGKGKMLGYFAKDEPTSDFSKGVSAALKKKNFTLTDITQPFAQLLTEKDAEEIELIKKACQATCAMYNKYLKEQIMDIIDADKRYKHSKLANGCIDAMKNKKYTAGIEEDALEMCYDPIIQSGDKVPLKFSTQSNSENLHFGSIVCALGLRYKMYCGNVIRTLMVNSSDSQSAAYDYLHALLDWAISKIKPGLKLADFHGMIQKKVATEKPAYAEKLLKSFGFVTGIEFRDGAMLIAPKSTSACFTKNCVVNLNIGFQALADPSAKDKKCAAYSLWIGDTIHVEDEGKVNVLTIEAKRRPKAVRLIIKEESESEEEEEEDLPSPAKKSNNQGSELLGRGHRRAIIDQKTRHENVSEDKRASRRRELFKALQEECMNRLTGLKQGTEKTEKARSNVAYKGLNQMPKEDDIRRLMVYVDKKYESIIIPIFGLPTPFHISTIKNVSISNEGQYTFLRINFNYPKTLVGAKESSNVPNPKATHVKELTLRALNTRRPGETGIPATNLQNANRLIKEVLKKFRSREAEERERANLVEQDDLVVNQAKGAFRLKDLYVRPNIISRRITGTLEAHSNGFRFVSANGDQIDVLYNNIKHAFYQPCDGEMLILLHFHLKNAIMYAKKKQIDIQFYAEVGELTTDLGKAHSRMHDRDDLEAEQRERDMREEIKRAFLSFTERAENLARKYKLEFESPFRELGFFGCPHRSTVKLMPTSSCLVSLTEFPPLVITLADVELVMFERVSLNIRTFDMVFVFKDYSKKVQSISSIPSQSLDIVKEWLLSCDLFYAEGQKSLNWVKLMKTVVDNPEGFLEEGGWSFIDPDDEEDEGEGEDSADEDENYAPSDEEESGEGDEDSDYSGSDAGSEDSDWDAEESESEASLDSDESEGLEWDELEAQAIKEDKKKDFEEEHSGRKRAMPPPAKHSKKARR